MNVTFLIGNGFDLNLGLPTKYSDFIQVYEQIKGKSDAMTNFHQYVGENNALWSSAEKALGLYTANFEVAEGEEFSNRHNDFCEHLIKYLSYLEMKLDLVANKEKVAESFARINQMIRSFPSQERKPIDALFKLRQHENLVYNFINFNYTNTLDRCLSILEESPSILGSHRYGSNTFIHKIGAHHHVHGTLQKGLVFGVDNDAQIAKPEIFDCINGDIYRSLLLKNEANVLYMENAEQKAVNLLNNSQIIYVYGMSIGETDASWWRRICLWLKQDVKRHLIIQKHDMVERTAFPREYLLAERTEKRKVLNFSSLSANENIAIEKQIHITRENIFLPISALGKHITGVPNWQTSIAKQIETDFWMEGMHQYMVASR